MRHDHARPAPVLAILGVAATLALTAGCGAADAEPDTEAGAASTGATPEATTPTPTPTPTPVDTPVPTPTSALEPPQPPVADPLLIEPGAIGPWRAGMTAQEAQASGLPVTRAVDDMCANRWSTDLPAGWTEFRAGDPDVLDLVYVGDGREGATYFHTAEGITVASTVSDVAEAYGDAVQPFTAEVEGGELSSLAVIDDGRAMVFSFGTDVGGWPVDETGTTDFVGSSMPITGISVASGDTTDDLAPLLVGGC